MSPIGGQVELGVKFTAKGIQEVLAAVDKIAGRIKLASTETKAATRSTTDLGRSFRNIALRTIAIIGIVRSFRLVTGAFREAVTAGLEYNEVIEQSRLAIATLISAQADLYDASGRQLDGVEKLNAAYALAVDQVRKLRIAGIQTAATTKELVDAFQQAVGAGLATGLTLDEIRTVTIRIAQAAGALGVPYRQLNEEIRSILGGIIDQNTRIAKALGITNDQVKLAKEQNRLAEFLLEKFEAFGVAGERIVETWAALKSNVRETLELFSGEVTFPMFEAVRTRGLVAVQRIFDFDTAEISKEFSEIKRVLQSVFAGVGDQIAGTFEKALDGASRLNGYLLENRESVNAIVFAFGELAASVGTLISGLTKLGLSAAKFAVETESASQYLESIADTLKTIGRSKALSALVAGGIGLGAFAVINAVLGSTAVVIGALILNIGWLVAAIDQYTTSAAEAIQEQRKLNDEQTKAMVGGDRAAAEAQRLGEEYEKISAALRDHTVKLDKVREAKARLLAIETELNALHPRYAAAVRNAVDLDGEYAKAIDAVIERQLKEVETQLAVNDLRRRFIEGTKDQMEQERELYERQHPIVTYWGKAYEWLKGIKETNVTEELNKELEQLGENSKNLELLAAAYRKILLGEEFTVVGGGEDPTDKLEAIRAGIEMEIEKIQQALRLREAQLKDELDNNLISYVAYYDELTFIQQEAYAKQIELRRQLAALEPDDPKKTSREEMQIIQLETQAKIKLLENETARRKAGEKFAEQAVALEVQLLESLGKAAEATRLKLVAEYEETVKQLLTMGAWGAAQIVRIGSFIDTEVARKELTELEDIISRAQQKVKDGREEIEGLQQVGAIGPQDAQARIADLYEGLAGTIGKLLPRMRELAALTGDPDSIARVEELEALFKSLGLEVKDLRDKWKEWRNEVYQAAANELGNYLTEAVMSAEDLGDAFTNLVGSLEGVRNLLGQIAAQIVEITARMIAMKIVQATAAFFGVPLPAAAEGGYVQAYATGGTVQAYAPGGMIRGPGTATSDSILARLSTGEFVVRAASVKKYGPDFLHALNVGAVPREVVDLKRYATGGMVGERPTQTVKDFHGELTVGLAPGLVLDQMNTPAGERMVLKVVAANRRGIRNALGL